MAMVWCGEQAKAYMANLVVVRIELAARWFRDRIREKLSVPGPAPSAPGEYPHKQMGHLRRNIQMQMDRAARAARVGTNVLYGKFLETGTSRMAARPWMSLAIAECIEGIKAILAGRMAA